MKKIIITLLAAVLALAFVGCSNTAATTAAETTTAAQEEKIDIYYGDLNYGGKTIEELRAYYMMIYGNNAGESQEGSITYQWRLTLYDDLTSAILGLERDDVKALCLLKPVADYIAACNEETMRSADYDGGIRTALSMATLDSNTELLEKLNAAIRALDADGTLEALEKEYTTDFSKLPEAAELPKIDGAETVRVVVTGDMPPYDYVTTDGKAAGYNVTLLSAIAEKVGLNFELVYANASSRYVQLTSGKADVIFWARGDLYSESAEFDFSADVPEGIAVTDPFTVQGYRAVVMK